MAITRQQLTLGVNMWFLVTFPISAMATAWSLLGMINWLSMSNTSQFLICAVAFIPSLLALTYHIGVLQKHSSAANYLGGKK